MPVVKVLRNRSNFVAGFALILMSVGLFALADPWMIWQYNGLDPSDRLTGAQSTLATASLCLIASLGVVFVRLRVELSGDGRVAVFNPLHTWHFDRAKITAITGEVIPRVTLDSGERIWLLPLEHSMADRLSDRDRAVPLRNAEHRGAIASGTDRPPRDTTRALVGVFPILVPWLLGAAACLVGFLVGSAR